MKVLQQITVPQESVNDQYVTVVGIPFETGDPVKKNDIVIELETSKAVLAIPAETDGFVEYFCVLDEEVGINKLIVQILDEPVKESHPITSIKQLSVEQPREEVSQIPVIYTGEYETLFSKKAEELIVQNKIDRERFKHFDFVTEDVVLDLINPTRIKASIQTSEQLAAPAKKEHQVNPEKVNIQKISSAKKREIDYLSNVQGTNLVSTIYMDIDLGSIFDSLNSSLKYFKDSLLPVIIYETSRLLIKFPTFNAFFNEGALAIYKEINIGIAMDIDDGLKVVKIPKTDGKTIAEIEDSLFALSNKYLDKVLETNDLTDITFTITDLSSQGAYFFTPLVNKGNSAILGIPKIDHKLNRVLLSLSFDHRVTEGKNATIFLYQLKERIESYSIGGNSKTNINKITCYKCMKKLKDDLNNKGFIKVINQNGEEKFICDACLFNS